MPGFSDLALDPLEDVRVSVVQHPGATLLSLLAGSVGGRPHGVPVRWRQAVREVVKQEGAEVLRPLFDPRTAAIPDCLSLTASMVSMGSVTEISAETYLAMLADLHPDTLLAELAVEFGPALPGQWRPVADRPRWWIERFARVMGVLWKEFQPAWQRAETSSAGSASGSEWERSPRRWIPCSSG